MKDKRKIVGLAALSLGAGMLIAWIIPCFGMFTAILLVCFGIWELMC